MIHSKTIAPSRRRAAAVTAGSARRGGSGWAMAPVTLLALLAVARGDAQELARGPFSRMVIRGVTLIDGTGAPPEGPFDIVVEGGRIREIRLVGDDFGKIDPAARPAPGEFELDADGMFLMPGFINAHVHIAGEGTTGLPPRYYYYLQLGHGITTILDAGSGNGLEWTVAQRDSSARHQIMAPRILAYVRPGMSFPSAVSTPEEAREWVRRVAQLGADGLKLSSHRPDVMAALIDEAHRQGLLTTAHLSQTGMSSQIRNSVARMNVVDAARLGLDHQQHWYGLPEALTPGIPDFRLLHNHNDEQVRFSDAGRFWDHAAEPGSARWNAVMEELLRADLSIIPTMSAYEKNRDLMRVKESEWNDLYAPPGLMDYWEPNPDHHGSRYYYWRTVDETHWRNFFVKWERFLKEFHDRGGRLAGGADEGTGWHLYGFGYIRELELLHEAGLHPLEVIRAVTLNGAEALKKEAELGTVERGKIADFVIVDENPLENLKVLYGTGAMKYDPETRTTSRVGGVRYTVKDGIVYDARALLVEVRRMVEEAGRQRVNRRAPAR